MQLKVIFTLLMVNAIVSVIGYKILVILPHPGKSHFDSFEPLLKALASKGHDLTVISYFPQADNLYKDIVLGSNISNGTNIVDFGDARGTPQRRFLVPYFMTPLAYQSCKDGFTNSEIEHIISSNVKFDLVVVELFVTRCYLGLLKKLDCPFIGVSSTSLFAWFATAGGFPNNPAFVPNAFSRFSTKMSFLQRVENVLLNIIQDLQFQVFVDYHDNMLIREYFGNHVSSVHAIAANMSLMLVNTHYSISHAQPVTPAYIEVGGMHIGTSQQVPEHIEKWINESTHGVIYFSMGSMIKGHTFPEEKRQMFLRAFARLPQRVLWKWETETMPGKPDNVLLLKWMPQFDILCHPNVKVFIAHGGLLGVTESVHCGVPMLLMPQFGDQFTNAKAIEANGGGLMLDFRYITEEQIFETLTSLLSDNFNKKAKELSARFKDRPMPPLETAIYWVEYVARHGGAPHLRTAAVGMPLYQYLLLDVIAFLLTIFIVFTYVWYKILKFIYRKIFSAKQKVKTN